MSALWKTWSSAFLVLCEGMTRGKGTPCSAACQGASGSVAREKDRVAFRSAKRMSLVISFIGLVSLGRRRHQSCVICNKSSASPLVPIMQTIRVPRVIRFTSQFTFPPLRHQSDRSTCYGPPCIPHLHPVSSRAPRG